MLRGRKIIKIVHRQMWTVIHPEYAVTRREMIGTSDELIEEWKKLRKAGADVVVHKRKAKPNLKGGIQ